MVHACMRAPARKQGMPDSGEKATSCCRDEEGFLEEADFNLDPKGWPEFKWME